MIRLSKILVVIELYNKNIKKWQKTGFRKNVIIKKKVFNSTFDTTILKPLTIPCYNFKFISFELNESVTAVPGRAGSPPISIIWSK